MTNLETASITADPAGMAEVDVQGNNGTEIVNPAVTTTYTLTATGKNTVPATQSVTVTVTAMPTATSILSFTAEPASITDGQTATLRVMAANATGLPRSPRPRTATAPCRSVLTARETSLDRRR